MEENQVVINVTQKWDEIIAQWKTSGKIASKWCKEQKINYQTFLKYRRRILGKAPKKSPLQRSSFVELPEKNQPIGTNAGIEIQVKEFSLILHKDFDSTTFERCLQILVKSC